MFSVIFLKGLFKGGWYNLFYDLSDSLMFVPS